MTSDLDHIYALATELDQAAMDARPIQMITGQRDDLTIDDAYAIQRTAVRMRTERGEAVVGLKLALTSRAKMDQAGVHAPITGYLTDRMQRSCGAVISRARHIHPRVEPELAMIMGSDLRGPVTSAMALRAVEAFAPALEIVDTRYRDFQYNVIDAIADNASAARFVLGDALVSARDVDPANLGVILEHNGRPVQFGSTAAVLDHPAHAIAAVANLLAEVGECLRPGDIVLTGGITQAVPADAGDRFLARFDALGTVSAWFGP